MTDEETSIARQIVSEWFWQPAEGHNYRYRGALRTMTRFFESAPMEPDVMKLVIEYLRDEVIEGGISLMNRSVDLGTGWKAMDAWFRTDETEKWAGTESRKVRVYQILMQQPADGDAVDGPYVLDKGCQYRVTHTYYWNVAALPESQASSSGISYALEGVVRDRETGLYSCVLTKRERVQQDVAEYLSEVTQFQETREEQHLGVRQGVSAGKSAGVSAGKTVERHVTKNEDCTHDVRNITRKDLPVSEAVVTAEETAFETRTSTEHRNQSRAAQAPARPGESVRNEKTPTKLFNQVKTVTVEKPVKGAAVEFRKSLHGTVRSVTDRNQAAPVTGANLKIGERRSSRMTDGGNYDNTSEQLTAEPAGDVAATGRKTVFEESASRRENVAAGGVLPQREADEAGDGKTHSVEVVLHEDGSADVTKTDTSEKPVKNAVVEYRKTVRGTVQSVTDRNQSAPVTPNDLQIGETRSSRMTEGGLYDNTRTVETGHPVNPIGQDILLSSERNVTSTTTVEPGDHPPFDPASPEPNTVMRQISRRNEFGTWDRTKETTTFHQQNGGGNVSSGGVSTTTTTRKLNSLDIGTSLIAEKNHVRTRDYQPNDHGSYTVVETDTSYNQVSGESVVETETETVRTVTYINYPTNSVQAPKNGRATIHPNDHGSFTVTITYITPKQKDSGWITWTMKQYTETKVYYYDCGLRIFKNFRTPPTPMSYSPVDIQITMNEYGLYDGCLSYKNLTSWANREIH